MKYSITAVKQTDSTQNHVKELFNQGASEGSCVVAAEQTNGRGRHGRHWISPLGNLYFSVLLTPPIASKKAVLLNYVACLAVTDAIMKFLENPDLLTIKWPNDILINQKKCAGILLELIQLENRWGIVLGSGINIQPADLPDNLQATELCHYSNRTLTPEIILESVLDALEKRYDSFLNDGFLPTKETWESLSGICGTRVRITSGDEIYEGIALGLDLEGALLLTTKSGTVRANLSGWQCS